MFVAHRRTWDEQKKNIDRSSSPANERNECEQKCQNLSEQEWDEMTSKMKENTNPITVSQLIGVHFIHTFCFFFLLFSYFWRIFVDYFVRLFYFVFRFYSVFFFLFFFIFFLNGNSHLTIEIHVDYFDYFISRCWLEWVWIRRCVPLVCTTVHLCLSVCHVNATTMPMNVYAYIGKKLTKKPCQQNTNAHHHVHNKWTSQANE